jgi:hypothetical protein
MGNVCGREEDEKTTQDVNHIQGNSQMRPAQPTDTVIPDRKSPSPVMMSSPDQGKIAAQTAATFVPTKDLNELNPAVKKAFEARKPRDFRSFPELKDHYATPIEKLKDTVSGDTYHGHVVRGVPHGWGTYINKKGEVVEGVFDNGKLHSHLRHITAEGNDFEGQLKDERRHGQGKLIRPDGSSLSCQTWVNGTPTGVVEERDPTGRLLFKGLRNEKGLYEGPCTIGFKDFTVEATFKDGVPTGSAKKTYNDGRIYEGSLNRDLQEEGAGVLAFVDGRQFKGPFVKGLANGKGTFISESGKSTEQTWKDGKRV